MPVREKGEGVPVRRLHVPSHVPGHTQTAAKVRGFSPIASGFAAETDWLRSLNAPVCDRDRDFESRFLQLGVCCELDFGRRAPMKASMWREPQRGPAISGNGVMCQGDPDVSRVLEADRSLPHQVEVYAASAQFGEIPPHHAEFGIELHPHRHHPIAAH